MSSHDMKNPNGGVNMRHVTEQPGPHSLLISLSFLAIVSYASSHAIRSHFGFMVLTGFADPHESENL